MKTTTIVSSLVFAAFLPAFTLAQKAPTSSVAGAASLTGGTGQEAGAKLKFANVAREGKSVLIGELEFGWAKKADKLTVTILVSPADKNLVPGKLGVIDNVATLSSRGRMRVVQKGQTVVIEGKVEMMITDMGKSKPDLFAIKFVPNKGDRTFTYSGSTLKGDFVVRKNDSP